VHRQAAWLLRVAGVLCHIAVIVSVCSFQSASKLYLVLDFINGGHLFFNLYRQVRGGGHRG